MNKYFCSLYVWFGAILLFCVKVEVNHAYNNQYVDNNNDDDDNPYKHIETLDKDGKYVLEWLVDWAQSRVIFHVTVQTKGYVGLGLSLKGKMSGADIVIGGVMSSGEPYFSDRHVLSASQLPVEDPRQDWDLHNAWENETHTFLSFSRPFETCDKDHDLPIHGDGIVLIWAFGEKDDGIEYHHQNRGSFITHLLDPDLAPRMLRSTEMPLKGNNFGKWKVWRISQQQVIPTKETTYMCSIHKTPVNRKSHVIGVRSILPTDVERRHIHHFVLTRCVPPGGRREDAPGIFEQYVGYQEECYVYSPPTGRIPTQYCSEFAHVWAVGQRPAFFPEHVGVPIYPNEYYLLQVHYDNPDVIPGIRVNHDFELFYTEKLRKHDAGLLLVSAVTPGPTSIMVPPNSLAHPIYGHCHPECTKTILPPKGIRAFAVYMHTHLAGRGVRVNHFRDGKELPWISNDDNFNYNYQQSRTLNKERVILPGDSLYFRCIYSNTDRNGNATIGGYSTKDETCAAVIWYYNKIKDRASCRSEIRSEEYHNFLQIHNTTWSADRIENVVTFPSSNAGLLVSQVASLRLNWTLGNRKRIGDYHRYLHQVSSCPSQILPAEVVNPSTNFGGVTGNNGNNETNWATPLTALLTKWFPPPPPSPSSSLPTKNDLDKIIQESRSLLLKYSSAFKDTKRHDVPEQENLWRTGKDNTNYFNINQEIRDTENEFISVYPHHIVPYERPSSCAAGVLRNKYKGGATYFIDRKGSEISST